MGIFGTSTLGVLAQAKLGDEPVTRVTWGGIVAIAILAAAVAIVWWWAGRKDKKDPW